MFSVVPSISSTDKSVCATLILPYLLERCYWEGPVWHRHSCLCFGKMQCLKLQPRRPLIRCTPHYANLEKISVAFVPPKPKEFDITFVTFCSRAVFGT
jgi:hypothetical protein